jgi:hypothetical protein
MLIQEDRIRLIHANRTALLDHIDETPTSYRICPLSDNIVVTAKRIQNALLNLTNQRHRAYSYLQQVVDSLHCWCTY